MPEKNITSESQKKAVKKYLARFADIKIRVEPEYRDEIQRHADQMGESVSAFIKRAIAETIERDLNK